MADLALRREEQDGLVVFMLHPAQGLVIQHRHVQFHLSGRMRIEILPNLGCKGMNSPGIGA